MAQSAPRCLETIVTMISAILGFFASESIGVVDTGSGAVDMLGRLPGYVLTLVSRAIDGLGS